MCGLVGMAGKIGKKENDVFRDLLMIDSIRGPHSTGIAAMPRYNNDAKLFKKALLPQELFQMNGIGEMFSDFGNHKILLGHNRWATVGKVNAVNAHPFELENLVGAHNGTLKQQHLLPDHTKFTTDSENIFHSFEKLGINETVPKLNGAYALTWFDKNESVMNFLRNDERTLYFTFINDDKTFVWASEAWMLEGVLARNGFAYQEVQPFDPMFHYTLEVPEREQSKFEKFHMKKVEGYVPPKYTSHYPPRKTSCAGESGKSTSGKSTATGTTTKKLSKTGVISDEDTSKYDHGDIVAFAVVAQSKSKTSKFVYGRDVFNSSSRFKVYIPNGSKVRKEMSQDASEWWAGVINGKDSDGHYIIQGNSVKTYDELSDDEFNKLQDDNANREQALRKAQLDALHEDEDSDDHVDQQEMFDEGAGDSEWDKHVTFIAGVGNCGWCNETLDPTHDNLIVNSQAVFCPSCKSLPDLQQFFPEE